MVFYYNARATMIEMKTEKGKQTYYQKKWESLVGKEGFEYVVVRNIGQFKDLIIKKLKEGGYKPSDGDLL